MIRLLELLKWIYVIMQHFLADPPHVKMSPAQIIYVVWQRSSRY